MRFRKKPVIIEARQFRFDGDWKLLADWCGGQLNTTSLIGPHIVIHTLEGDHKALLGDWIIRGVQGEFYPCKDSIFTQTYEPVNEEKQT